MNMSIPLHQTKYLHIKCSLNILAFPQHFLVVFCQLLKKLCVVLFCFFALPASHIVLCIKRFPFSFIWLSVVFCFPARQNVLYCFPVFCLFSVLFCSHGLWKCCVLQTRPPVSWVVCPVVKIFCVELLMLFCCESHSVALSLIPLLQMFSSS